MSSIVTKIFYEIMMVILMNVIFLDTVSMCQQKELHNSVNQYFPIDQFMMLYSHTWVTDLLRMKDKKMGFGAEKNKKFIDMVSDSTL